MTVFDLIGCSGFRECRQVALIWPIVPRQRMSLNHWLCLYCTHFPSCSLRLWCWKWRSTTPLWIIAENPATPPEAQNCRQSAISSWPLSAWPHWIRSWTPGFTCCLGRSCCESFASWQVPSPAAPRRDGKGGTSCCQTKSGAHREAGCMPTTFLAPPPYCEYGHPRSVRFPL